MNRFLPVLGLLFACGVTAARAQNTVFNAALSGDSMQPSTYPTVTPTTTGWDGLSNKGAAAPTESGNVLTLNMAATTSGFFEAQALFASSTVQLLPGTYIEVTTTFVPTYVLTANSDNLIFGLFNSGGSAPLNGLLSSGLTSGLATFTTGGAKGWLGYNANIPLTGGSPSMKTRAAQTGTNNTVQSVLVDSQSTSVGYSTPAGVSASSIGAFSTTFTNGSTYTLDYKLALSSDSATLTATVSLYNGAGTTGTGANTLVGSYTGKFTTGASTIVTKAFDAFAIGWRADAGQVGNLKLSSFTVQTTGGAPWFITPPVSSLSASLGGSVSIPTSVGGTVSSYQWQVSTNGGSTYTNLDTTANASAASATLTLSNVQATDAGLYRLVVTNAGGSTASSACTLTVTNSAVAPSITTNPASATVTGGTAQTFSVAANGTAPLTYQWYYSADNTTFTAIAGATASAYTLSSAALTDEGYYKVTVTNVAGSATSTTAQLTVNQPLTINVQPVGAALSVGGSYTLAVTAVGKPAPQYQWYLNGTAISGATSSTYAIASAAAANSGLYTVVVTNSAGDSVTSSSAAISVVSPTLAAGAFTPAASASGVIPDARLTVTFNQAVAVGLSGTIKIYDATNATAPVDTIDLVAANALMKSLRTSGGTISTQALPVQTKTIGGVTNFDYYPITVSGSTATIYPRNGVLANNKTYYVTIDPGVFTDSTGLSYAGISTTTGWRFSTRTTGPASGATLITVAADGTGDFCTVQGALDFIPAANTTARTIFIKKGTYFEEVYFTAKHSLTFLGEDRAQTLIVYPNNNTFNNASGTYHRMVFNADHANNTAIVDLSITNSTPKGGSQAEALILNGNTTAQAIVSNVTLFSYQDTLQISGQAYVTDSHISGDVDFMWGGGPCFFNHCEITQLTSGGYFTQIRNGTSTHGYVFSNCRFDASAGVANSYLGRIDPAGFPNSEVVILDSTFGNSTNNAFLNPTTGVSGTSYAGGWWLLNSVSNASTATNVHNWTNNLVNANGVATSNPNTDAFTVMPTDATTQANYRSVPWVLGTNFAGTSTFSTWTPTLAPLIATAPTAQTINAGSGFTLSVQAFGIPALTYQWYENGIAISGATSASYAVASASALDAGTYSVVVSNGTSSVTTTAVPVVVHNAPPVITRQPANTSGLLGTTATLNVWASGDAPFSYQWYKDGSAISGATSQSLRLTGLGAASAGGYSVVVSNAYGSTTSSSAALTMVSPATTVPTLPSIPAVVFDVTAYGAVGDGATDNTAAIQAAINAAKAAGGGTVELPPASGAYLCGPITLASHLDLQVDAGAMLQALPYGTYPNSTTSPSHFITVPKNSTDVEFSGGGTIDGNGAAWWAAYNANSSAPRPRLVQITTTSNMLFTGVTFSNSPNFNLAFSSANTNVTLFGITIYAPGDSPNTDGMDLAGTNFLVQNCSVSDGDDDIVAKPGSVFCRNIYIAGCTIGTGHGVSIGGQTNVGLDGMVVTNCTFNGTSTALRMKADPTEGGPVQNVTFSNLTMTNVTYPILFYSYYNLLGSPGATSGSSQITPAKVNTYNAAPPTSLALTTIPTWKNITLTNITVTSGSGYSTIWGLPTADGLIQNVTFNNVNISGGAGVELYDAANIQFTGTNSVGTFVTDNALAITGQPGGKTINAGDSVTFSATAIGGSGTNNTGLTYQWNLNGTPLANGLQADGSTISGATTATLAIANARVTGAGNYTVTVSTTLDGYNVATSTLVANSLPVLATSAPAALIVNPVPAAIALANTTFTYDGAARVPAVTTSPANVAVQLTYNGSPAAPSNAGSYAVVATLADPNYTGTAATATLTIQPAAATIALSNLAFTYDGTVKSATATTSPANVAVSLAYNGGTALPLGAGAYAVLATTADPNYAGSATGTLTIAKATPALVWPAPAAITYGAALGATQLNATASTAGTFVYTPAAGTVLNAGGNQALAVGFTPSDAANFTTATAATTITVNKASASMTLGGLTATYDGASKPVTATTSPVGLAVALTYDGSATAPTSAGSYAIAATVTDPNYTGGATGTLVIAKATPVLAWTAPAAITYGTVLGATQLNATANTAGTFVYTPKAGTILGAGANQALSVGFTPADAVNYSPASAATTISVDKANATVALGNLAQTYDGTAKSVTVTTTPSGLPVILTYHGGSATPAAAGSYAVVATVNSANYAGSAAGTLVIGKASATVLLAPLTQRYDGTAKTVTATTTPAGLTVDLSYDGTSAAPIYPGPHTVVATITDANYTGTKTDTLTLTVAALVRHAPTLNGIVGGSIEVLSAESFALNSNAAVSDDLLVPGTPTVQVNGHPTFAGTKTGAGSATPSGYTVTLNGNAVLRYLVSHVDAMALPAVAAPAAPGGTRSVTLNKSTDSAGDFTTVRDLTLNGNAGPVAVPPGTYGNLGANGNSGFVLGVAGATVPAVYNLQNLTLNGAMLQLAGPVTLTLANGVTLDGSVGDAAHPDWFVLKVSSGGLTLNGNATLVGVVLAPNGTVTLNGNAALHGSVMADRLTLNGNGLIDDGTPE